ncbi:MAG: alpha-ribazole phosphatase [Chloroflexota bacterium]
MTRLLMVRHGETELNSSIRYWGRSDVKLSAQGLSQAERLRDRMVMENIDAIYSSNLVRARVTAEIIASEHQLKVESCPEIAEINFGDLEGLTFDEIKSSYPEVAKKWMVRSPEFEYPGGESREGFNQRVAGFLPRLENHGAKENLLIVAHSGVLRTLICQILKMPIDLRWQLRIDLASLSIMETYQSTAILTLLNDVSHLR